MPVKGDFKVILFDAATKHTYARETQAIDARDALRIVTGQLIYPSDWYGYTALVSEYGSEAVYLYRLDPPAEERFTAVPLS